MPVPDVCWNTEHGRFNYRVGGVCIERQRVLLNQEVGTDYWFLPGGRCQLMEPAADTLRREMREELEVTVRVGRMLWIVELATLRGPKLVMAAAPLPPNEESTSTRSSVIWPAL